MEGRRGLIDVNAAQGEQVAVIPGTLQFRVAYSRHGRRRCAGGL